MIICPKIGVGQHKMVTSLQKIYAISWNTVLYSLDISATQSLYHTINMRIICFFFTTRRWKLRMVFVERLGENVDIFAIG